MQGTAITGQLLTSLHLDDFAIWIKLPDLLQSQRVFLRV